MNWETLSQIAQIFEGVAVVAAIIFGYVQLKHYRQQRDDTAALELMRSFHDAEFIDAFRQVYLTAEERREGPEFERAAIQIATRFETLGQAAFRETIPFHMIEDLVGGAVVGLWNRISPFILKTRQEQNDPLFMEWFQWLAEQLEARGRTEEDPAFVREKSWVPNSS